MLTVNHQCKFCRAAVRLEIDDEALKFMDLGKWKSMAACNRCADFMSYRANVYDQIRFAALSWHCCKSNDKEDKERKVELLAKLEKLLKDWLDVMNEYFRVRVEWDLSIMNSFIEEKVPVE